MEGVVSFVAKKALGAPEARRRWCKCCEEHAEMISQEAKTNPRYNQLRMWFNTDEPHR